MCLYPKIIKNPKYLPNKKNGGHPPKCEDERCMYVPIGCGQCIECRKKKAREWQVRLNEQIKTNPNGKFVTLTFSPEELNTLIQETKVCESNAIAAIAVRRFLERVRKETKKSIPHWLITELGHNNSERIHLHGLLFTDKSPEWIEAKWKYGQIYVGEYVNSRTINYIVKYVTKIDTDHKNFNSQIFCSAGLGATYINSYNFKRNKYVPHETEETYRLPNGGKTALPVYYRNKRYTDNEREKLWIEKLDKMERYVLGVKIDVSENEDEYFEILKNAQEYNKLLGYGDDSAEWKKEKYNITLNMLRKAKMKADYMANNKDYKEYIEKRLKNLRKKNK